MHPILFEIPWIHFPIHIYGLSIMIGFLAGVGLGLHKAHKLGIDINDMLDMAMTVMVAGVIGARLFYIIDYSHVFHATTLRDDPWNLLRVWDIFTRGNGQQWAWYVIGLTLGGFLGLRFYRMLARIYYERRDPAFREAWANRAKNKGGHPELYERLKPQRPLLKFLRAFCVVFIAVLFTRALYVGMDRLLSQQPRYDLSLINTLGGGLVLYGCILLSIPTGVFFVWLKNMPLLRIADLSAPSYALGISVGRIGCYYNGCCWGRVVEPGSFWEKWALHFPVDSPPYNHHLDHAEQYGATVQTIVDSAQSLGVIPTQLISSASLFVMFLGLNFFYYFKGRRVGDVMYAFGIWYTIHRFIIERLRDDNPDMITGLTISGNVSVLVLLLTCGLIYWTRKKFNPPHPFES